MKIRKKSWHFQLCSHSSSNFRSVYGRPTNLCSYFWFVVWILFVSFMKILGVVCAAAAVLSIVGSMIISWVFMACGYFPWTGGFDDTFWGSVCFWGSLVTAIGILYGIVLLIVYLIKKIYGRMPNRDSGVRTEYRKPKEPGLVSAWLKARKEQVCPLIEFVD